MFQAQSTRPAAAASTIAARWQLIGALKSARNGVKRRPTTGWPATWWYKPLQDLAGFMRSLTAKLRGLKSQMVNRTLSRWLVLLSLLGLQLLAIAPPQAAFARPFDQTNKNRSTLCGRLVFLEDYKTGAKMIGLIPCTESRPIIFATGPAELYDFYRFTNVVIKKGD